jgi:transposase-like protein
MRYQACEKLEIIQFVGQSHLSVRRTLEKLGIPRATFYRWYDLYHTGLGRSLAPAGSRLEPDPRRGARADHQARAR